MSEAANVRAINSLDELRSALVQFRAGAQESLQAVAQEIGRTLDWLGERKQHWQNEVRRREEVVQAARKELSRCEASGYRDEDGHYHQPDCSSRQHALLQAQMRLREAEAELETVRSWANLVQQAADAYQQKARQLNDYLASDVTKATASLGSSADTLRTYATAVMSLASDVSIADTGQTYATETKDVSPSEMTWTELQETINRKFAAGESVTTAELESLYSKLSNSQSGTLVEDTSWIARVMEAESYFEAMRDSREATDLRDAILAVLKAKGYWRSKP
jgi:hypothetical protein